MKGARLAELQALGLRVPAFVVVSPDQDPSIELGSFLEMNSGPFAVRSSADAEDGPGASFAGIFESYLSVPTKEVLIRVDDVRQSLHTPRAEKYQNRVGVRPKAMHVVVQQMVTCKSAGIAFSQHPNSPDLGIIIEACWGIGELAVSGLVETDQIHFDSASERISQYSVGFQGERLVVSDAGPVREHVDLLDQCRRKLADDDAFAIRDAVLAIRAAFGMEVDIEWGIDQDGLVLLQARPLTVASHS